MDPRWSQPPPYPPAAPQQYPYPPAQAPPRYPYQGAPDGLMLAGAIVGIALGSMMVLMMVFQLLVFSFVNQTVQEQGDPSIEIFPFRIVMGFLVVLLALAVAGIVGAGLVFSARSRLRRTDGADGRSRAIAGSVLMILGPTMLGGILALVGVLLVPDRPR